MSEKVFDPRTYDYNNLRPSAHVRTPLFRVARAHLRQDTIDRFQSFTIGTAWGKFQVLKEHIFLRQKDVLEIARCSITAMNNAWTKQCDKLFGERRRWPGPDSDYHTYYIQRPNPGLTRDEITEIGVQRNERKFRKLLGMKRAVPEEDDKTVDDGESTTSDTKAY